MLQAWKALCEPSLNFLETFDVLLERWVPSNRAIFQTWTNIRCEGSYQTVDVTRKKTLQDQIRHSAHDGPHMGLHPGCAQGQGRGQRLRDTGAYLMSRNVCYTVPSDVLSLHALTSRSTFTSVQCQTARCNVYITE